MNDHFQLFVRFTGISLRAQMQYRTSFGLLVLSHFLSTGIEFLGIAALFHRFGTLRGWTLGEAALFYGVVNVAFATAEGAARGFDQFSNMVRSGDFDRLLLRPLSTAFQVAAQEMQLMRIGRLAQGLIVLGWGAAHAGIIWTFGRAVLLAASVAGGSALFYGLFIFQAAASFWTVETLEIMNTVTYGGTETGQYPMSIYRPWFRRFFTFVIPLACMNYIPLSLVLGRADPSGNLRWLSPLAGLLFLAVSLRAWQYGVRHYRSTGS